MNTFATLSEMANRSTIYKRHETRNSLHTDNGAGQPAHAPHVPVDNSIGETLSNLTRRSTIHKHRELHHHEMHHDNNAGQRHMEAPMAHHHDGIFETLNSMVGESSIFDRNLRRNEFLQS